METVTVDVLFHFERCCAFYLVSDSGASKKPNRNSAIRDYSITKKDGSVVYIRAYCDANWPSTLVMNSIFGAKNGFIEGELVILSLTVNVGPVFQVELSPQSVDDWDIFESNVQLLESSLISQIPLISSGIIYPVWAQNLCLFATAKILSPICDFGCLTEGSEVHVVPILSTKFNSLERKNEKRFQNSRLISHNQFYYLKPLISLRILPKYSILGNKDIAFCPPECHQPHLAFCLLENVCTSGYIQLLSNFEENQSLIMQLICDCDIRIELLLLSHNSTERFRNIYQTLKQYPNHVLIHDHLSNSLKCSNLTWIELKPIDKPPPAINKSSLIIGIDKKNPFEASPCGISDMIRSWINIVSTSKFPVFIPRNGLYVHLPIGTTKITPGNKEDLKIYPFAKIDVEIVRMDIPDEKRGLGGASSVRELNLQEFDIKPYELVVDNAVAYVSFNIGMGGERHYCSDIAHANLLLAGKAGSEVNKAAHQTLRILVEKYLVYYEEIDCKFLKGKRVETIDKLLSDNVKESKLRHPAVLLLKDLDCLCPGISESNPEFNFHLNKLAACLKRFLTQQGVFVIATVSDIRKLHEELRERCFTKVIDMPVLDKSDRCTILDDFIKSIEGFVCDHAITDEIAGLTEGYTVTDLRRTTQQAVMNCMNRDGRTRTPMGLSFHDWKCSLGTVTPMRLHSAQLYQPDNEKSWDDIGGMKEVKLELEKIFIWPSKYPDLYGQIGIRLTRGALLYGPSGCGKTLMASVIAHKCNMNIISIKGPELMSKYIGASEEAVRDVFSRAENAKPCLLFFDEFDSLAPRRGHDSTGVTDRVVNQLLTQLDGIETLQGVFVIAACSRPDLIDPALLRPGRIDKSIYCGLPNNTDRFEILQSLSRGVALADDVQLEEVADVTAGRSGADLKAVLTDANINAVHRAEHMQQNDAWVIIENEDLVYALESLPPLTPTSSRIYEGVSDEDIMKHQKLSLA